MSRVIKFRFWCDTHRYVKSGFNEPIETVFFNQRDELGLSCPLCYKSRPMKLEQWTGLLDATGTPVFEGDILRFTYWWFDGNLAETPMVGVVVYVPSEASYGLSRIRNKEWLRHIGSDEEDTQTFSGWDFTPDDIDILGNIHENPELLESTS